jgi:hypothetical protein
VTCLKGSRAGVVTYTATVSFTGFLSVIAGVISYGALIFSAGAACCMVTGVVPNIPGIFITRLRAITGEIPYIPQIAIAGLETVARTRSMRAGVMSTGIFASAFLFFRRRDTPHIYTHSDCHYNHYNKREKQANTLQLYFSFLKVIINYIRYSHRTDEAIQKE